MGKVKDPVVDQEDWKVTHIEVELSKETCEQVFGVKPGYFENPRNVLAISALEKAWHVAMKREYILKFQKGQLAVYLRPA